MYLVLHGDTELRTLSTDSPPERCQVGRNLKLCEVLTRHSDVLQLRHELAVKTAHRVPSEEPQRKCQSVEHH